MSKWREVRFKNVIEFNPRVKLEKNKEYPNIGIADIDENKFHVFENEKLKYIGQSSSKFESGDILFSRITPCLENRKIARVFLNSENKGFGSTEFFVFRGMKDITVTSYVGYLAQTDIIVLPAINSMTGASGRQRADRYFIEKLKIKIPDLETQEKIANVLSSYDELIENNNRRIELLENMAEEIYKEWFVRMRFPGHDKTKFEKGIPEGWEVKKIGEFIPIITGKKDANYGVENGDYLFFTCAQEPIRANGYSFDNHAILLAGNGDLNVKMYRGKFEAYQRTYVLIPYENKYIYLLYFNILKNVNSLINQAAGTVIKYLTRGMIEKISFLNPNEDILRKFNIINKNIYNKLELLNKQNENLMKQRDMLLPRLMNGSVEVK